MPEKQLLDCPFCKEHSIEILYYHKNMITKSCRGSGTTRAHTSFSKPRVVFISGCPKCGKTKEEVEKEYNNQNNKESSREDVIKRLREAGLDPTKLK